MALAKTGTYTATVPVKALPSVPAIPAAGTGVINYSPFILTNNGRSFGESSDLIIVNEIAVESVDGADSGADSTTTGSFAMYVCTMAATFDGSGYEVVTPAALDSADGAPTGITAFAGMVGGVTARTQMSATNILAAQFGLTLSIVPSYGPYGLFKQFPVLSGEVEAPSIANGEAFQVRKPDVGSADSLLTVTVTVRTSTGKTYIYEAVSGFGQDIITILNSTGSRLSILDVTIADWVRSTVISPRYEVVVTTANNRVDTPAQFLAHDSTQALPSWVSGGSGFYVREGADMWVDFVETLDIQSPVPNIVRVAGASARSNRPFSTGRETSKYLRPGKTLIFGFPATGLPQIGTHDIRVTFTTYAEEVVASGGGEYSYAY